MTNTVSSWTTYTAHIPQPINIGYGNVRSRLGGLPSWSAAGYILHLAATLIDNFRGHWRCLAIYLLYLDESGNPDAWQSQNHFVLGGVAIHEGQIFRLTRELDVIQSRYFPNIQMPIVLHATDIRSGVGRFRELGSDGQKQLLDDIYGFIHGIRFPRLVAFATAIHISAVTSPVQARRDTLEDICQRFNTFLIRLYKSGHPGKGLLIIDRTREEQYRQLITEFQRAGTTYGYIGNIVDIPYFARCRDTRMLQLADFCAYAVYRYYEKEDSSYIDKILDRFDRKMRGHPPDGLKHITRVRACPCYGCSWRR